MVWMGPDSRGRLAKSLVTLYKQIEKAYPVRDTSSDGTIGDWRHEQGKSEHNVRRTDTPGICRALDITNDPPTLSSRRLAERLLASRDPRLLYVISDAQIAGPHTDWKWKPYTRSNPHRAHMHLSVVSNPDKYDDPRPWDIEGMSEPTPTSSVNRLKMAKAIFDNEARYDANGKLAVYKLPRNDRGGTYEVAGINDKHHKAVVDKLVALIKAKKYAEAEKLAIETIAEQTDPVVSWHDSDAVESYLRDTAFNRGLRGAARILQRAVGVEDDGIVGPITKRAIEAVPTPEELLTKLRDARESYERDVVGYRPEFWAGLVNRWNNALTTARGFA